MFAGKEANVTGEGGGGEGGYNGKNGELFAVGNGVGVVVVAVVGMVDDDEGYFGFCFCVEGEG